MTQAATALDYTLTQIDRERAQVYLNQCVNGLKGAIQGLSTAQWRFSPRPECWSIAEITEHVLFIYERVTGPMREMLAKAPPPPANHDRERIDNIVLGRFPNRIAKMSAPSFVQPRGCFQSVSEALEALRVARNNLETYLSSASDLRGHALEALPLKAVTEGAEEFLDGYQWFLAANAHAERHTKQILEIRAEDAFPAW